MPSPCAAMHKDFYSFAFTSARQRFVRFARLYGDAIAGYDAWQN
jgi:hypothetical protein